MTIKRSAVALVAALLFGACSSEPPKTGPQGAAAKPEPKATEALTARAAFQKLFATARLWAGDARPVRLESEVTPDANGHDGKAAVWRAVFASPAKRGIEAFVWSGSSAEGAPERGIGHGGEDTFNPSNSSTQPFDPGFLKQDSDVAFTVAQKHGGDKLTKKDANQMVAYLLDWDPRTNQLVWHVAYGPSRRDSKLTIDVDATSGEYIRTEK